MRDEALSALIAVEEYDDCTSTMVEIRPGVGGGESSLFADDILNMVIGYSAEMGWNCKVIFHINFRQSLIKRIHRLTKDVNMEFFK